MPFSPDKPDEKKKKVSLGYILKIHYKSSQWVVFIHVDDLEAIAGQSVAGDDVFWLCFTV